MTKSTEPASSLTLKSVTAIPSLTPGASLSIIVPTASPSTMLINVVDRLERMIDKSSVASNRLSSTIVMVTDCTSPLVPAKVREPLAAVVV